MIVDDSATMRAALGRMVEKMGHKAILVAGGQEAIAQFSAQRPDMILLDVLMGDMDGYSVAREIRAMGDATWVPIIFLSSREEDQDLDRGIEAGGDDYLVKPPSYVVLHAKIRAMLRIDEMQRRLLKVTEDLAVANRELERLSHFDGLTGIANRRFLDSYLSQEVERSRRTGIALTVVLCDIDHFKKFNDRYGHLEGDQCLIRVAHALQASCRRGTDLAARFGGEEFAIILPGTNVVGACRTADALLQSIRDLDIAHPDSSFGRVTVSMGIESLIAGADSTMLTVLERADEALYRAKQSGRNCFVLAEGLVTERPVLKSV